MSEWDEVGMASTTRPPEGWVGADGGWRALWFDVDLLIARVQKASIDRERRVRLLMESGGFTVDQAAAIHDLIAELCADMSAEESERG